MPITIAVPKELKTGEKRVALVPDVAKRLQDQGLEVLLQKNAAHGIHQPDSIFESATIVKTAEALNQQADIIFKVQPPTLDEIKQYQSGTIVISYMEPYGDTERFTAMAEQGVTSFSMELVPRISRAPKRPRFTSPCSPPPQAPSAPPKS